MHTFSSGCKQAQEKIPVNQKQIPAQPGYNGHFIYLQRKKSELRIPQAASSDLLLFRIVTWKHEHLSPNHSTKQKWDILGDRNKERDRD